MKKLLIITTVLGSLLSSMTFAKTEGNYIGIDLLATNYRNIGADGKKNSVDPGLGINYKYAINMNGLYLAPAVYINYNNSDIILNNGGGETKSSLNHSYGAKLELGYDVTDKIAPFLGFAIQESQHNLRGNMLGKEIIEDYSAKSTVYEAGVKYSINTNVDVALAYNYVNYSNSDVKINSVNPEVYKLGFAYKF